MQYIIVMGTRYHVHHAPYVYYIQYRNTGSSRISSSKVDLWPAEPEITHNAVMHSYVHEVMLYLENTSMMNTIATVIVGV